MTSPSPSTLSREKDKLTDFLTDVEIAKRWGVSDKTARRAMKALERAGGFPKKDPLFGGKRYWPAVDAFMKGRNGLTVLPVETDGQENWNEQAPASRRRARHAMATTR
jgi:hypothetical protein